MKLKDSYHPYAIVTILFWAIAYSFTRLALHHFGPFSLGFLRYVAASSVLAVAAVAMKIAPPQKKDWPAITASGAFGFFLYMVAFNKGSVTVTAATSSLIIATAPILTALLARIVLKESLRALQWVAIAVEFVGILILTLMDGILSINTGIFWLLLAALALSAYNLMQRYLTKRYSALRCTTYSIFAGTAMLGVFLPQSVSDLATASPPYIGYVLLLGIFPSAVAYVCWSKAIAKAKNTSSVSNYMFAIPFVTAIFAYFIAGEALERSTAIGGVIILAGMFLYNYGGKKAPPSLDLRPMAREELTLWAAVIREGFGTVAEEFGLTEENCPTNGAFLQHPWLETQFDRGNRMFGLYVEGHPAGFLELEAKGEGRVELQKLTVLPCYRHGGYGGKMLDFAVARAREMGGHVLALGIIEENTLLKEWYRRYGFVHTGTKDFHHLPFRVGFLELDLQADRHHRRKKGEPMDETRLEHAAEG